MKKQAAGRCRDNEIPAFRSTATCRIWLMEVLVGEEGGEFPGSR